MPPAVSAEADKPVAKKTYATLNRGRVYFLAAKDGTSIEFVNGKKVFVSAEQVAHLKEHAVDQITLERENEYEVRQKFLFDDLTDAEFAQAQAHEREVERNRDQPQDLKPRQTGPRQRVR